MAVSYRTAITILQIIFFTPSLVLSIALCFLQAASTWRFIAILSALRTAGAISYFIALSNPSTNVYASVIVCELVGIAPLVLTLVALLGRVNVATKTLPRLTPVYISIFSLIGLILAIIGVSRELEATSNLKEIEPSAFVVAAISLLLVSCGSMLLFGTLVAFDTTLHRVKRRSLGVEYRLLPTVGVAAPFVVVRMVYSASGAFSRRRAFSILNGSNTVYLLMDVVMEIMAVSICLSSAYFAPASKAKKNKKGERHDGQKMTCSSASSSS